MTPTPCQIANNAPLATRPYMPPADRRLEVNRRPAGDPDRRLTGGFFGRRLLGGGLNRRLLGGGPKPAADMRFPAGG